MTPTLLKLWEDARKPDAHEIKAMHFWRHFHAKVAFKEEHWNVASEAGPAIQSLRRMDGVIQFLDLDGNLRVLCVGEGKKHSASQAAVRLCEDQALDACRQYLATHEFSFVRIPLPI